MKTSGRRLSFLFWLFSNEMYPKKMDSSRRFKPGFCFPVNRCWNDSIRVGQAFGKMFNYGTVME